MEQDGLQQWPYNLMSPMFAQDVGWIGFSRDKSVYIGTGGEGFADVVVRQHEVAFVQAGMGLSSTVNHGLVVPKED